MWQVRKGERGRGERERSFFLFLFCFSIFSFILLVLFDGWKVTNCGYYTLTLLFWFLAGILYELINFVLVHKQLHEVQKNFHPLVSRISLALLYFVKMFFAYVIMLVAMTYNVGLIFSVVLGMAVGFFLFSSNAYISNVHGEQYLSINAGSSSCHWKWVDSFENSFDIYFSALKFSELSPSSCMFLQILVFFISIVVMIGWKTPRIK